MDHRYGINRPSPRHGQKYNKYKNCTSVMVLLCTQQHLSDIWDSIHKNVKNTEADMLIKKVCSLFTKH